MVSACHNQETESGYEPTSIPVEINVVKVGILPYMNSKQTYLAFRPVLDYLETHIENVEFILETSKTYAAFNQKFFAGDFAFALANPYQTSLSLDKGYRAIAKMKSDEIFKGYIVARKDAGLTSVAQLKGKTISFPAPTALAGTMMPLYFLHEQGLDVHKEIKKNFVGSQYSSILNAYSSDAIAAATWPPSWYNWAKKNPHKAEQMTIVWQTEPLINNGFVVREDVDKRLSESVVTALVQMSRSEKGKQILSNAGFEGFEEANNTTYDVVKSFLGKYDKAIGLPQ